MIGTDREQLLGMLHTKTYQKSIGLSKKMVPQDAFVARAHIQHAASLGLAPALTNLAKSYTNTQNELSLTEDHLLSLHHYHLASVCGDPEADLALSNCFWWGQQGSWEPNEKIAYLYGKMSANEGHGPAYCQVGYFHERGIGANIDLAEARAYYLKGAAAGDKVAINRLDGLRRAGGRVLGVQK
jgi:TPR repeat protein